jgi:hypothetical protein
MATCNGDATTGLRGDRGLLCDDNLPRRSQLHRDDLAGKFATDTRIEFDRTPQKLDRTA